MQVLEGGEKEGEISLFFPAVPARVAPAPEGAEVGAPDALPGFANAVMGVRAELSVVLHRLRMPLNAVTALRVGQVIEVPADALFETGLVAGNGKRVVEVQLGQSRGFRAVRLLPTRDAGQAAGGPARAAKGEAAGTGVAAIAAPGGVDDVVSASMQDLPDLSDLPELSDLPVLADIAETGGGIADIASADTGFAPDPMTPEAEEEEEADLDLGGGFPMAAMGDLPPLD